MAAHARLKNEFTEDEKYYNLTFYYFPWQERDEIRFESYCRIEHVLTGFWLHALKGTYNFQLPDLILKKRKENTNWNKQIDGVLRLQDIWLYVCNSGTKNMITSASHPYAEKFTDSI